MGTGADEVEWKGRGKETETKANPGSGIRVFLLGGQVRSRAAEPQTDLLWPDVRGRDLPSRLCRTRVRVVPMCRPSLLHVQASIKNTPWRADVLAHVRGEEIGRRHGPLFRSEFIHYFITRL